MKENIIKLNVGGASAVGTSLGASFNTDAQNLFSIYAFCIQLEWTGGSAPVGTFTLQGSADPGNSNIILPNNPAPTTWTTIDNSSKAISGTPGNIMYDVTQCSYRWVRLVYTRTSGSATVSKAYIQVKGVA